MFLARDEKIRRKVNLLSDTTLVEQQVVNYSFSRPFIANKKVLDVGCWTGLFAKYALAYAKEVVGIDPGEKAIELARKLAPKAKFTVGSAEKLPFFKNSFDAVTLFDVLEHVPQKKEEEVIREINRVLKPNGHLVITTPNKHFLSILMDPAYFLYGHRHYSLKALQKMLKQNGFQIIHSFTQGGLLSSIVPNISLLAKYILKRQIQFPARIRKVVEENYKKRGFLSNTIVAKKVRSSPSKVDNYQSPNNPTSP